MKLARASSGQHLESAADGSQHHALLSALLQKPHIHLYHARQRLDGLGPRAWRLHTPMQQTKLKPDVLPSHRWGVA